APVVADVRATADIDRIVEQSIATFGGIDVLVNVAGGMYAFHPLRKLIEWSDDVWDDIIERNLRYVFKMCRAVIPVVARHGRGGSIINIVSISGTQSAPRHAAYGAAKSGLLNLNRSLAVEHGPDGIRVNGVAPGAILTPATERALTGDQLEAYRTVI